MFVAHFYFQNNFHSVDTYSENRPYIVIMSGVGTTYTFFPINRLNIIYLIG